MGVSPPAALVLPNAITLGQEIRHHRTKRKASKGRQALSPSSSYIAFYFIS